MRDVRKRCPGTNGRLRRTSPSSVLMMLACFGLIWFVSLDAVGQAGDRAMLDREIDELEARVEVMKRRLQVLRQEAAAVTRESEFFVRDSTGKELRLLYYQDHPLVLQDEAGYVVTYGNNVYFDWGEPLVPAGSAILYYLTEDCSGPAYVPLSRQGGLLRVEQSGQTRIYRLPLTAEPVLVTPQSRTRFLPYFPCEEPDAIGETGTRWLFPLPSTWEPVDDHLLQPPLQLVRRKP